jgi:DNA-binding GntR family transcriptional regulator
MVDKIVDNLGGDVAAVRDGGSAPAGDGGLAPAGVVRQDRAHARGPDRPDHGASPAEPRVEDELRDAIATGRFQPNQRLVEAELTEALGVGRSAVRTALARLEQEGLVEHERNRGARVRLVAEREAVEILEARAVLEGLVARQAASKATSLDVEALRRILDRMRRLLDRGDLLGASDENAMLHRRLLEIAGHETATRLIATLKSQLVRFQYRTILLPGRSERSFAEHRTIVEAVASRDPDCAEAAMRTHLSHVAEALRGDRGRHPDHNRTPNDDRAPKNDRPPTSIARGKPITHGKGGAR